MHRKKNLLLVIVLFKLSYNYIRRMRLPRNLVGTNLTFSLNDNSNKKKNVLVVEVQDNLISH